MCQILCFFVSYHLEVDGFLCRLVLEESQCLEYINMIKFSEDMQSKARDISLLKKKELSPLE